MVTFYLVLTDGCVECLSYPQSLPASAVWRLAGLVLPGIVRMAPGVLWMFAEAAARALAMQVHPAAWSAFA